MPMPKPKKGESKSDYVSRCMGDKGMIDEYPDEEQRSAVAHSMWDESKKKSFELTDLADSLGSRLMLNRWGVGTALQYVKAIGSSGPDIYGITPDAWTKEMQSAAERLTYCDESSGDTEFITKSIREGTDISAGAVLEYDAMMVTRRKDRDGDILEPSGLDIDTKMPLLAHHVQAAPYGKHVAIIKQNDDAWVSRWAIADFPLGRDMAVLTRFGSIRKSHGFKPLPGEFEPIEVVKGADGKSRANGWHIKRAGVFEGSGVSIPSNVDGNVLTIYEKQFDGICTAFSRDMLETDAMKTWAKSFYDQRPTQARGMSLEDMAEQRSEPQQTKDGGEVETKGIGETLEDYEFPGSYEWIRERLSKQLGNDIDIGYRYIAATFAKYVIACHSMRDDYGKRSMKCYKRMWKLDDDKMPVFDGEPKEIKVEPKIIEKMVADLETKSIGDGGGQVLSTIEERDATLMEISRSLMAKAIGHDNDDEVIAALEPIEKALGAVRQQRQSQSLEELFAD